MARIDISIEIRDRELLDDEDSTGLSEEGFDQIHDALLAYGTDIDIRRSLRG